MSAGASVALSVNAPLDDGHRAAARRTRSAVARHGTRCSSPGRVPCPGRARRPPGPVRRCKAASSPGTYPARARGRTGSAGAGARTWILAPGGHARGDPGGIRDIRRADRS